MFDLKNHRIFIDQQSHDKNNILFNYLHLLNDKKTNAVYNNKQLKQKKKVPLRAPSLILYHSIKQTMEDQLFS